MPRHLCKHLRAFCTHAAKLLSPNSVGFVCTKQCACSHQSCRICSKMLTHWSDQRPSYLELHISTQSLAKQKVCRRKLRGLWRDIASIGHSDGATEFPRTCKQHPQVRMQHHAASLLQLSIELPAAVIDELSHSYFCALWAGDLGRL
jgi:hypothetical protein